MGVLTNEQNINPLQCHFYHGLPEIKSITVTILTTIPFFKQVSDKIFPAGKKQTTGKAETNDSSA